MVVIFCIALYLLASYVTMLVAVRRAFRAGKADEMDVVFVFLFSFVFFPFLVFYGLVVLLFKMVTIGIDKEE